MKVLNSKELSKQGKAFECYSIPLYKFLFSENGIYPVDSFKHSRTKKECWIFLKTEKLQMLLDEWKEKKEVE